MSYTAPVKDMLFCMKELADLEAIARLPGFEDASLETAHHRVHSVISLQHLFLLLF